MAAVAVTALAVSGHACFYFLIRRSRELNISPAQLSAYQGRFAILVTCLGYTMLGSVRGATLMVLLVILVFCAFTLEAKKTQSLSLFSVALLGLAMLYMWLSDPASFKLRTELIHFILVATMVIVVSVLTGRMNELRRTLHRQKSELAVALTRIQDLAIRDELTGLPNRRHIITLLESEIPHRPLCLALLDLDRFKGINDTYGHAAGDEVLRRLAAGAQSLLRPTDVLARWGGEEFLLLLPQTTLPQAHTLLDSFRTHAEGWAIAYGATNLQITFSAGLVELGCREHYRHAIERADALLYQAKSEGRNRVVSQQPSAAVPLHRVLAQT